VFVRFLMAFMCVFSRWRVGDSTASMGEEAAGARCELAGRRFFADRIQEAPAMQ
jgi:hypothetical protein